MANATLTAQGQTTIPKDIRDALNLQAQDQLNFTLMPDGTVLIRVKKRKQQDFADAGCLHRAHQPPTQVLQKP